MLSSCARVVVVGCGGIARAHAGVISPANIVALCDSDLNSAERLRAEFDLSVPLFDSLESALVVCSPDAAIVCTPPTTHFALVSGALAAGLDVLCEKPLAVSELQAQELTALALGYGLTLRTSAKYRFCAGVVAAKRWLHTEKAGELRRMKIAFGVPFDFARSWHANVAVSGGGVWMDNGPHALDLARYFVGELVLEKVEEWQCEGALDTEGRVSLRSAAGARVEIALSWLRGLGECFAVLECEKGTIEIGWRETIWRAPYSSPRVLAGAYDKKSCFAAQWHGFLNGDARLGEYDGAKAVELIESIYRAAMATPFRESICRD